MARFPVVEGQTICLLLEDCVAGCVSCGPREPNWPCFLGGWDGIANWSLANGGCLWAHVCWRGKMVLSPVCSTLPCYAAWAAVHKDVVGWLRVSQRKCVVVCSHCMIGKSYLVGEIWQLAKSTGHGDGRNKRNPFIILASVFQKSSTIQIPVN